MVVLDGMLTSTDKTSYLAGLARQGHYHARIAGCVPFFVGFFGGGGVGDWWDGVFGWLVGWLVGLDVCMYVCMYR